MTKVLLPPALLEIEIESEEDEDKVGPFSVLGGGANHKPNIFPSLSHQGPASAAAAVEREATNRLTIGHLEHTERRVSENVLSFKCCCRRYQS